MSQSVVVGRAPRCRPSPGRAWAQRAGCRFRPRGARRPCYRESCVELVVCACSDQDSKRLVVSDASRCSRRQLVQQRPRHTFCIGDSRARCWPQPTSERHSVEEQGTAAAWFEVRTRSGRGSSAARRAVPASERPGRAGAQRAGCGLRPRGARRPCYRESCVELVVCACSDQDSKRLAVSDGSRCSRRPLVEQRSRHTVCPGDLCTLLGAAHERAASRRGTGDGRRLVPGQATQRSRKLGCARAVPASERSGRAGARSRPSSSWGACAPGRHERLLPKIAVPRRAPGSETQPAAARWGESGRDRVRAAGLQRPPHNKRLMPAGLLRRQSEPRRDSSGLGDPARPHLRAA